MFNQRLDLFKSILIVIILQLCQTNIESFEKIEHHFRLSETHMRIEERPNKFNDLLFQTSQPIIGLKFIEELSDENSKQIRFKCILCDYVQDFCQMFVHLNCYSHQFKVLVSLHQFGSRQSKSSPKPEQIIIELTHYGDLVMRPEWPLRLPITSLVVSKPYFTQFDSIFRKSFHQRTKFLKKSRKLNLHLSHQSFSRKRSQRLKKRSAVALYHFLRTRSPLLSTILTTKLNLPIVSNIVEAHHRLSSAQSSETSALTDHWTKNRQKNVQ